MGKIKSKLIKRTAKSLMDKGVEFTDEFDNNKNMLKGTLPSKKIRNQLSGYLARIKKQEKKEIKVRDFD